METQPSCTRSASSVRAALAPVASLMAEEANVREAIRSVKNDIDEIIRKVTSVKYSMHVAGSDVLVLAREILQIASTSESHWRSLSDLLPVGKYYKFKEMWRFQITSLTTDIVLARFLLDNTLIPIEEVKKHLGGDALEVDLEDYLLGICSVPSELSRLCVNATAGGDYDMAERCASFVSDLHAAFGLLNLKNDAVRKKYDSIKYELKKIEEVRYDISIRQLKRKANVISAGDESDETLK